MICPANKVECDNPGCRHGGCQGRLPELPLFRAISALHAQAPARPHGCAPEPLHTGNDKAGAER